MLVTSSRWGRGCFWFGPQYGLQKELACQTAVPYLSTQGSAFRAGRASRRLGGHFHFFVVQFPNANASGTRAHARVDGTWMPLWHVDATIVSSIGHDLGIVTKRHPSCRHAAPVCCIPLPAAARSAGGPSFAIAPLPRTDGGERHPKATCLHKDELLSPGCSASGLAKIAKTNVHAAVRCSPCAVLCLQLGCHSFVLQIREGAEVPASWSQIQKWRHHRDITLSKLRRLFKRPAVDSRADACLLFLSLRAST